MKKGLSIFMSPTGVLLLSLFPSFTNPVIASETKHSTDTAYYYNEKGTLIRQQPHALRPGCFVIRTRKKFRELYSDFLRSDTVTMHDETPYKPAEVQSIPRRLARKVEWLIREGKIYDPLVIDNVFEILDQESLHRMRSNIKGGCGDTDDPSNYQEFGGLVQEDGTITFFAGNTGDPRRMEGSSLYIRGAGQVEYHSHPAGYVETNESSAADQVSNMVTITGSKNRTSERRYIAYIQAPSSVDQQAVGKRTGYVFGMSSRLIYIYDRQGVKATLPIGFAERKPRKSTPAVNVSLAIR